MKKRSLSLLLSLVLLVVLMLGSCVSVLAADFAISVTSDLGQNGYVCVGDTVTFTAPKYSAWLIDGVYFDDGFSFTHTFSGAWGDVIRVSAVAYDWDNDGMTIRIVPKINIDGNDSGLRVAPGQTVTLPTPSKAGYNFTGYTTTDVELSGNGFNMPRKNVNLTTNWEKIEEPEEEKDEGIDPETTRGTGFNGLLPEEEPVVAEAPVTEVPALSPQTADNAPVALFAALALVSAAAFVSMKKRG